VHVDSHFTVSLYERNLTVSFWKSYIDIVAKDTLAVNNTDNKQSIFLDINQQFGSPALDTAQKKISPDFLGQHRTIASKRQNNQLSGGNPRKEVEEDCLRVLRAYRIKLPSRAWQPESD